VKASEIGYFQIVVLRWTNSLHAAFSGEPRSHPPSRGGHVRTLLENSLCAIAWSVGLYHRLPPWLIFMVSGAPKAHAVSYNIAPGNPRISSRFLIRSNE